MRIFIPSIYISNPADDHLEVDRLSSKVKDLRQFVKRLKQCPTQRIIFYLVIDPCCDRQAITSEDPRDNGIVRFFGAIPQFYNHTGRFGIGFKSEEINFSVICLN